MIGCVLLMVQQHDLPLASLMLTGLYLFFLSFSSRKPEFTENQAVPGSRVHCAGGHAGIDATGISRRVSGTG
jgi:hypothetical protein